MRFSRRRLFLSEPAAGASGALLAPGEAATGRRFTGETLREIASPLGGIASVSVAKML